MAFVLGCEKVGLEYPTTRVFEELSLGVEEGDRIGIVGRNGHGKSTLLKVMAGLVEPDTGRVLRNGAVSVGVLGQSDALDDADTVQRAVVGDAPEYEWAGDARVRDIIDGLLGGIAWDAPVGTLSGGQRRRVDLARLLVGQWDVLMLDEPTNHLDVRAITWLAEHLRRRWRPGAGVLLVVTHDRWFLDEVCTRMWEVHDGTVDLFEGGYSAYILQRVERQRLAALAEQKRQNALRRELAWLSRGARARATKPKFHVAAARELIADVPELRNPPELKRMAVARIGKDVVELQGASVRYEDGDRAVLDGIDWIVGPGDRIGIVGGNGAGKTTLLNVVRGALKPTGGRVKIGATVRFAMLSQRLEDLSEFDGDRVREVVGRYPHRRMADGKEMTSSKILEDLGFGRDDLNEFVRDLSGGQRRRLALMMILMEESNVLILDEPGNDLDIDMLAALEDMLDGWPGTLLLVTHDRNLMERATDDQFALIDGKLRHLPGGIDEFLRITELAHGGRQDGDPSVAKRPPEPDGSEASVLHPAQLSNKERQRLKKLAASCEKKMATTQAKIDEASARMHDIDPTDYVALAACQDEAADLESRLSELETEWLEALESLGE